MKRKELAVGFLVVVVLGLVACDSGRFSNSSKNEKTDSLFLGISMGMDKKAFYDYCWEMNSKGMFTHGPTNQSVEYKLEAAELGKPVSMQFYPNFYNDKIYEMPVLFNYEAWAPWNRELSADTLMLRLVPLFKKWYGDDFTKLDHPVQGVVYYQMKGRRRINLFVRDDQFVQAVFTDLKIEKELKEMRQNSTNGQ